MANKTIQFHNYEASSFKSYLIVSKENFLSIFPTTTDEQLERYFAHRDGYCLYLEDLLPDLDPDIYNITITIEATKNEHQSL
jgi:hypothetical protein